MVTQKRLEFETFGYMYIFCTYILYFMSYISITYHKGSRDEDLSKNSYLEKMYIFLRSLDVQTEFTEKSAIWPIFLRIFSFGHIFGMLQAISM